MVNKILSVIIIILLITIGIAGFVYLSSPGDNGSNVPEVVLTGETKEFEIIAKNWEFSPSVIEVNLGDKIELHLKSIEGTHGFAIAEFGISETLTPGGDIHITIIANKKGSFNFYCNVPCGRGHGGMGGVLIVK